MVHRSFAEGRWLLRARFLLLLLLLGMPAAVSAQAPSRAELAADPFWFRLYHREFNSFQRGATSRVDSAGFFFSPDGKRDPLAELRAAVERFSEPAASDEQQDPACQFPLRYRWLREQLQADWKPLEERCPKLQRLINRTLPGAVYLVFPQSFMQNPASLFGHSFLRLARPGASPLLDQTVSFAADTQQQRGVAFALRGLFGGYRGHFFYAPYHRRLKQYGDIDNRDIWEYRLALTHEERERLLLHLRELERAAFDYYFLDENCSYHLLSLLEVARASLELHRSSKLWVIPADTLRTTLKQQGFVTGVHYRPAPATLLRLASARLSRKELALVKGAAAGTVPQELQQLPSERQALVLETALAWGRFENRLEPQREHRLLSARSALYGLPPQLRVQAQPAPPDVGHRSERLRLGVGAEGEEGFVLLGYRLAYHDHLDSAQGYLPNTDLVFFEPELRLDFDSAAARLERMTLVRLRAAPRSEALLESIAWEGSASLERYRFDSTTSSLMPSARFAVGRSDGQGLLELTNFIEGTLLASDEFSMRALLGVAVRTELRLELSPATRAQFAAKYGFWQNDAEPLRSLRLNLRHELYGDLALGFEGSYQNEFGRFRPALMGSLYYFY